MGLKRINTLKMQKIITTMIVALIAALWCTTFSFVDFGDFSTDIVAYMFAVLVPICVIGVLGTLSIRKQENAKKKLVMFFGVLAFVFAMLLYFSFWKSRDYIDYLNHWCNGYSALSVKDSLYHIVDISNYTPFYNYFLIVISKLGVNTLLGIKFVTFCFSILLAFAMELLVCTAKKDKFNFLRLVFFIAIPSVCVEYASWGQCDAIYTSFCMLSLYFALKRKSKLSFVFVGLAFATKMQFLFIVPILFVMLLIKDENGNHYLKWKDIWIAPLMYLINFLPVVVGRNPVDVLMVYFRQVNEYGYISANAGNICQIYNIFGMTEDWWVYKPLVYLHTAATIALLCVLLVYTLKIYKAKKSFSELELIRFEILISMIMAFFMPKMHDRFFYIPVMLGFVYLFSSTNESHKMMAAMLEFALFGTMLGFYMKSISTAFLVVASIVMVLAVVFNFVVILLLSKELKNDYGKLLKTEKGVNNE